MSVPRLDLDLRDGLIRKRKGSIGRIVIFTSGKGGVGKSTISAHVAHVLGKTERVGILDIDLHGPSIPYILGLDDGHFEESKDGLIPPTLQGVAVMSVELFAGDRGLPFRGEDKSGIIKDLFAITNFGDLDYLIVDTPPGTGDEFMTAIEMFRGKEGLVFISMPNYTSWNVTSRAIEVAKSMNTKIEGVIGNMGKDAVGLEEKCKSKGVRYLGIIGYHPTIIDKAPNQIPDSNYLQELEEIVHRLIH